MGDNMESGVKIEKLIKKGAEASLFFGYWFGKKALFKHRLPKSYRIEALDKDIRKVRTLNEAKALIKLKAYGVNVPQVFEINLESAIITMKFIEGEKLKDLMNSLNSSDKLNIFKDIGRQIAILHINGHIHGDITTSNMIVTQEGDVFLIDFGLHDYSDKIEDKSVDLHLLKRVLISSHGNDYESCYAAFLKGYEAEYKNQKNEVYSDIIKNINVIETRGRYVNKKERN
ncbi:MAG: KEOPS complex kinase/ATPase Bud32 [Candidatus Thorarchaeota archaeon]